MFVVKKKKNIELFIMNYQKEQIYCIAPIFGGGFILAILAHLTKSTTYKQRKHFTD
jgi:hypothetical protein